MEHTNPFSIFTEATKFIVGNKSSDNPEELIDLYIDSKFDGCYQFAVAIVSCYNQAKLQNNRDMLENFSEIIPVVNAYQLSLEDYNKSTRSFDDRKDFIDWVEYNIKESGR